MAINKCRDEIRTAAGANLSNEAIDRIIQSVRAHGEGLKRKGAQGEPFAQAARELSDMDKAVAERKKLIAYQDLQKRQSLHQAVSDYHAQGLKLAQGIDALTRGISEPVKGARFSTAAEQLARQNDFTGRLLASFDKIPGALDAWRDRALTPEWTRELAELNKKDGKPGISKSPLAQKIAQAVQDAQDLARYHLNKSGAWIGDYEGYVSKTRHDPIKIDKAGFEPWKDYTLQRLDQDKTFADLESDSDLGQAPDRGALVDRFMKNVWDALSTGVHLSSDHGVAAKAPAFQGPGNMGKRLSSERVLHWKDADGWREYQEKFGDPSIERGVMDGLLRAGRDTALMNRWGSNPQYTFDNLLRTLREKYRDDHVAIGELGKSEKRLREEFAYLTGEASRPGNSLAWKIRGGLLAFQDITKLPFVLFTHMSVGATKPFQLAYHGVGRWQAYTSVLRNLVQDTSPEGKAVMENLRANAAGQTQHILSGYEPIDSVPGKIAALRMQMMRLGGLPWMLARQKSGSEWELSNFLGQQVGKEFDALKPSTQRALGIYGIGQPEWDTLRNAPNHDKDVDGSTYLTPKAASRAPDSAIDALAGDRIGQATSPEDADRIREETRDRLAMNLATYYSDSAERSTVTPGISERAFFSNHLGRFSGPIIGQYKTWALAAVRQMWGQAVFGSSKAEALSSLAELAAVGTALGYARMAITDTLKGKEPRFFTGDMAQNAKIVGAAMAQGGGLGIMGDYLFGEFDRYGHDLTENLAGPAVGDVSDMAKIVYGLAHAPFEQDSGGHPFRNAGSEALRFAIDHTPAVNLFYTREIVNWLILNRLQEMANPGYLERYQAKVKKQTGQEFWLAPNHYLGSPSVQ